MSFRISKLYALISHLMDRDLTLDIQFFSIISKFNVCYISQIMALNLIFFAFKIIVFKDDFKTNFK